MAAATITSKGQITIPKHIRALLNLHSGDKINFIVEDSGEVRFLPATQDITTLKGIVAKPKTPVSIDDMKAAIKAKGSRR